ncbi:g1167 [Coccomyxa elongata]
MPTGKRAVYLFHRDLRTVDSTGLIALAKGGLTIIPVFILAPEQIDRKRNRYFSDAAVQVMADALVDLDASLRQLKSSLRLFRGDAIEVLRALHGRTEFQELHSGDDVTPYSKARDNRIEQWCRGAGVAFYIHQDVDLLGMNDGLLQGGRPYTVFSAFYKRVLRDCRVRPVDSHALRPSDLLPGSTRVQDCIPIKSVRKLYEHNPRLAIAGGRRQALRRMRVLDEMQDYESRREFPALQNGTSMMSAHIKFGAVSIREVYWRLVKRYGARHSLVRELWFRSFYYHITNCFPHTLHGRPLRLKYERIPWRKDPESLERWSEGTTGIPLCDAGARCLRQTGYVHNRVRMVMASVLCKNLLISWVVGERLLARQLADYDPTSNNHGWQFIAGSGPDARWDRTMNPMTQAAKYDPDAGYIKRWIPELTDVPAADIHRWDERYSRHEDTGYPGPIVNLKESRLRAIRVYGDALR